MGKHLDDLVAAAGMPLADLLETEADRRFDDPFLRAEEASLRAAVMDGRLDPSALWEFRETVLSGPTGFGPIGQPGSEHANVLASEDVGWIRMGEGMGAALQAFNPAARDQMVRYLYWLVGHNPIARNIVQVYTTFTIGEGFKINWKRDTDRERWRLVRREVEWDQRVHSIIWHTYLLGEWFSLFLPITQSLRGGPDGKLHRVTMNLSAQDKPRVIRGLGPEQINRVIVRGDPDYDRGSVPDVETVLGYLRQDSQTILAAADVEHHRFERIGGMTRGISILFPVLRYLRFHDKWIENRHWLNFMRARIPLIRKVAGSTSRVNAENLRQQKIPPPGTLVTENMATEWKFPESNLQATDARHDGRAILLAISAGVSLPEFVVTADASNQNYSSAFAAESPMVKLFERLQQVWIPQIRRLVMHVTGAGDDEFSVEPGAIIRRSLKQTIDPLVQLFDRGVISARTLAARAGFDWDEEQDQMRVEQEERGGFAAELVTDQAPPKSRAGVGGRPQRTEFPGPGDDGEGGRRPRPGET